MSNKTRVQETEAPSNEVDAGAEAPAPATDAASTEGEPRASPKTVAAALGEIAWLLSQSPVHRHHLFVGDVEWLVMPPLTAGQYRLFYAEQRPVGAAFWAYVAAETEQRLRGSGARLRASEWHGGDRLWVIELIAPFGHQDRMLEDLRRTALADRSFRFVRTQPNGRREVVELSGEDVPGQE